MTGLLEGAPGLPGVSRTDAAGFILEGVRNTLRGEGCTLSLPRHIVKDFKQPASSTIVPWHHATRVWLLQCSMCSCAQTPPDAVYV